MKKKILNIVISRVSEEILKKSQTFLKFSNIPKFAVRYQQSQNELKLFSTDYLVVVVVVVVFQIVL